MLINYKDTQKILTYEELDDKFSLITSGKESYILFVNLPTNAIVKYSNYAGKQGLEAEYDSDKNNLFIRCSSRVAIRRYYDGTAHVAEGRNSMGCSESWYNPYYAIAQTFDAATVDNMEDSELENLVKLAEAIQDALY